ncbi:MAG: MarR family winged helix-turn-helix transcriptional regulator [Thermocrispum sp.]
MTASELHLDNQVCFALYKASRTMTQLYRPMLDGLGLTYSQYLVMLVLWERSPVGMKDLGAELDLDSGTLSPVLKRLKAAGLVTSARRADDERSVEISLTSAGRLLRTRAEPIPRKIACATQLQDEELIALRSTLVALIDSMKESQPAPAQAH